jgi:hypothetical protein
MLLHIIWKKNGNNFPWFVVSSIHEKSINPNCQDYKFKKLIVSSLNIYALYGKFKITTVK